MKKFYSQFINRGDLCFDIGANIGYYTNLFLQLDATVVAAEPLSSCFQDLKKRFEKNKNLTLIQQAIGSSQSEGRILICNRSEVSSLSKEFISFYQRDSTLYWKESERVKITTLDLLIKKHGLPKFCKIDVEGFEVEVFRGLSQKIPFISFEFNYPFREKAIECIEILEQLGNARYNYSTFENFKFELPQWVNSEELIIKIRNFPSNILTGDIFVNYY